MRKQIRNFNQFLNENKISEGDVISFIKKQMEEDKKEYSGHIPSKFNKGSEWSDFSWLVDEIHMFLNNEYLTSYILREFNDKYDYNTLEEIIKNNFKQEYEYALQKMNEGIEYDDLGFILPDSVGVVSFEEAKKSNRIMYTEKIDYFYTRHGGLMKTDHYDTIQSLGLGNCYPALSKERYNELLDKF
jgi:hypothetical protein